MSDASAHPAAASASLEIPSIPAVSLAHTGNRQIALAFLRSAQGSMTLTALPWVVIGAGGKSSDVGLAGTVVTITYLAACLVAPRIGRTVGRQRLIVAACSFTLLILAAMASSRSVLALFLLAGLFGITAGLFWPTVVGWLSAGQQGDPLNRRLGRFNASWSAGAIVGTLAAGPLLSRTWLPFVVAFAIECVTIALAATAPRPTQDPVETAAPDTSGPVAPNAMMRVAALAFAAAWLGMGVIRYPLVSAIKELSLGPRTHSVIAAALSLTLSIAFYLLARSNRWQHSSAVILSAGLVASIALGAIALCGSGWSMGLLVIVASAGMAVCSQADLYWRASTKRDRAASMASHEVLASVVFAVGSWGGGWVGARFGISWTFPAAASLMLVAMAAAAVAATSRKRASASPAGAAR